MWLYLKIENNKDHASKIFGFMLNGTILHF